MLLKPAKQLMHLVQKNSSVLVRSTDKTFVTNIQQRIKQAKAILHVNCPMQDLLICDMASMKNVLIKTATCHVQKSISFPILFQRKPQRNIL